MTFITAHCDHEYCVVDVAARALNIGSIFQLPLCLELSRCLRELSFRCLGTMGFVTAFQGHVVHAESHADLLQEVVRKSSPNKDESVVVRNFPYLAGNFKEHGVLPDLDGNGIEQDGDFPAMPAFFHALGIATRVTVSRTECIAGLCP